jgi:hypothetical protein
MGPLNNSLASKSSSVPNNFYGSLSTQSTTSLDTGLELRATYSMVPDLPTQPTPHVAPGTVRTGGTEKRDASSVSYRMNFKK